MKEISGRKVRRCVERVKVVCLEQRISYYFCFLRITVQ